MSVPADEIRGAARRAMDAMLERAADPREHPALGSELIALNRQPFTAAQLAGYADAMLARAIALPPLELSRFRYPLVDTCGTGGDSASQCSTFNISTASALLVSACGVPVAKHGNRAATSKCGSADVLEALGIAIQVSPAEAAASLEGRGFAFLFAPGFHPALRPLAPVRKALGVRTVFNLMGPLVNPARPRRQVVGVPARELVPVFAEALESLGSEHAIVVHAADGADEITLTGVTYVAEARSGAEYLPVEYLGTRKDNEGGIRTLGPETFGFAAHTAAEPYAGGAAAQNAALLKSLFVTPEEAPEEHREVVIANAAAALVAVGAAENWRRGAELAAEGLHSGAAARKLEELREPL